MESKLREFDEEAKKSDHYCPTCHAWYKKQMIALLEHQLSNKMTRKADFGSIKSIVSGCICRIVVLMNGKIDEITLNSLSNQYTDALMAEWEGKNETSCDVSYPRPA
jgi:hypothetical protein